MYLVIGRRKWMLPIMRNRADDWLMREIGNAVIGYAIPIMPDGLIIEQTEDEQSPRYFETYRSEIFEISMDSLVGIITDKQATRAPEVTYREIQEEIQIAAGVIHAINGNIAPEAKQ